MSTPTPENRPAAATAKSKDDPPGPPTCRFCNKIFRDDDALRAHKQAKFLEEDRDENQVAIHIYCHICDLDFMTRVAGYHHYQQNHLKKQDITCPGCSEHFAKISAFVQHIELRQCPKITQQSAAARCQANINFAKSLSMLDKERGETKASKDFSIYLGRDEQPLQSFWSTEPETSSWAIPTAEGWGPAACAPKTSAHPQMAHQDYRHGNGKVADLLTGGENNPLDGKQGANPWASGKELFPDAAPAQKPTIEQMQRLRFDQNAAAEQARHGNTNTNDPTHPRFNADKCFNPFTKKWSCPLCKDSCKSKAALVQHLGSLKHKVQEGKVEKNISCPVCYSRFVSLSALAAHVESPSQRCRIRESAIYEIFLGQLTWDLIEVTGWDKEDGSLRYDISAKAKQDYGIVEHAVAKPTFGHQQVYGSQSGSGSVGAPITQPLLLTSDALAQLDQQQPGVQRGPTSTVASTMPLNKPSDVQSVVPSHTQSAMPFAAPSHFRSTMPRTTQSSEDSSLTEMEKHLSIKYPNAPQAGIRPYAEYSNTEQLKAMVAKTRMAQNAPPTVTSQKNTQQPRQQWQHSGAALNTTSMTTSANAWQQRAREFQQQKEQQQKRSTGVSRNGPPAAAEGNAWQQKTENSQQQQSSIMASTGLTTEALANLDVQQAQSGGFRAAPKQQDDDDGGWSDVGDKTALSQQEDDDDGAWSNGENLDW